MLGRTGGVGVAICLLACVPGRLVAQPAMLEGHTEPVYAAAYTPDGRWIATASFDGTVRLWEAATGRLERTMTGHQGLVLAVALSRDGSRLASGGLDRTIKLWDVPTTAEKRRFEGHEGAVLAVAVSQDGKWHASSGADTKLRLRSTEDPNTVRDIAGNESPITRIDFRDDFQQIATGNEAGIVRVFNPADGAPLGAIGAHAGKVTGVAWAPNNSYLLTAGSDGFLRRWPNSLPAARTIAGHSGHVLRLRISPNGQRVVSSSADKTVRLANFGDGNLVKALEGHAQPVTALAFSPNSAQVATGGDDKITRLFDANNGNLVKEFAAMPDRVTAVAVHPNGQELAVGDAQGAIKIWKTADATEIRALAGHGGAITGLAWTPNGASFVSASADKSVRIWNPADGAEQRKIDVGTPLACLDVSADSGRLVVGGEDKVVRSYQIGDGAPLLVLEGHAGAITAVEYSRDNQRIVSSSDDGDTRIWDRNTKQPLQHFPLPKGAACASFHADHRTIAYGGAANEIRVETLSAVFATKADETAVNDLVVNSNSGNFATAGESGSVRLWDGNGNLAREFAGATAAVTSIDMSPNGGQIAAGSRDKRLRVWNGGDGKLQYDVETPSEVAHVAFSPDGKKLVCVGEDRSIRAYDPAPPNPQPEQPASREVMQTLAGHEKPIRDVAFAADNRTLVTASEDGTLRTWAIAAVGMTANLTGHGDAVYGLAFDATGKQLFSTSNDKTVRVWNLDTNQAVATPSNQNNGTQYGIAVSADGSRFAVAGADNSVRSFDTTNNVQIRRYTGPEYTLYDVALSPDGTTIAAGGMGLGSNRPIHLWNVDGEQSTKRLERHEDDCYALEFNTAGNRLLSVGYSGSVRIWDVAGGQPVFETNLDQVLYSGTYSPDGTRIAVSAADGKVHFVDVPENAR